MTIIPQHVSIIMDGNGRWAKQKGLGRIEGHKEGITAVREASEFAAENGIRYLSLFAFSEENWSRPPEEVFGLMELMMDAISSETGTLIKNKIRFRAVGDLSRLPGNLEDKIRNVELLTQSNSRMDLIIFLSYGGKWDILQAAERYAELYCAARLEGKLPQPLTPELFSSFLSTSGIPDPDLLIRTSGEMRISNFLLWQTAYSEFYFPEILWPDFRKKDFQKALDLYSRRERRFGKTAEQIKKL
ncbi:MAG: polyprenyl diphosphate synthase [Bacteroidales bacterium]|nr:polyprenyl diphosphate synthase [Bacteroidales bacterium]MDD3988847.1 polyprenyl diphosphate synthase [Bacteroidales bacterium]MDD4639683.1 polyprenyl diphosphate synthase [Bacteroidales bacterium]